jgi:hypothetical protein
MALEKLQACGPRLRSAFQKSEPDPRPLDDIPTVLFSVQLFNGDLAIVDRSLTPQSGDVVVLDLDGERSFKI